jgi:hypothetical protein
MGYNIKEFDQAIIVAAFLFLNVFRPAIVLQLFLPVPT